MCIDRICYRRLTAFAYNGPLLQTETLWRREIFIVCVPRGFSMSSLSQNVAWAF